MAKLNLRELYPDYYDIDTYVDVTDEVVETIKAYDRAQAAYERKIRQHKAYYTTDRNDGIEKDQLCKSKSLDEILQDQEMRNELYDAVMNLPEKQAKRIYAYYFLGFNMTEIAQLEGVTKNAVSISISGGIGKLQKILRKIFEEA